MEAPLSVGQFVGICLLELGETRHLSLTEVHKMASLSLHLLFEISTTCWVHFDVITHDWTLDKRIMLHLNIAKCKMGGGRLKCRKKNLGLTMKVKFITSADCMLDLRMM